MSGITVPAGWQQAKLGDLIQLEYGKSLPAKVRDSNGSIVVYGSSGPVGVHSEAIVSGPAVVVGRKGNVGSVFFSNEDFWPIDTAYFVRETPCADIRFLYYLLQSLRLERLDRSTAIPGLNRDDAYDLPVLLPPLAEQNRIVEKIETLFAELDKGEESLRQVQTLLARYRQSVLKAAVTEFTGSSETVRLGELLEDIRYGTAKKCRAEVEGVPVLRIPNVVTGQIELEDLKFAELEEKELSRLSLTRGDVLLVRSNGSANLVGRTAVVDDRAAGMAFAGYLIRLRVDRNRILPEFLHIVLNSPEVRAKIERQARSTSGVHNINSTEVRAIEFELPTVATQSEIVEQVGEQVANADLLEAACIAELSRSAALRQSILKDAFSGRLVPQDPHDEPASELLARIRQSRDAGKGTAPQRKTRTAGGRGLEAGAG